MSEKTTEKVCKSGEEMLKAGRDCVFCGNYEPLYNENCRGCFFYHNARINQARTDRFTQKTEQQDFDTNSEEQNETGEPNCPECENVDCDKNPAKKENREGFDIAFVSMTIEDGDFRFDGEGSPDEMITLAASAIYGACQMSGISMDRIIQLVVDSIPMFEEGEYDDGTEN